MARFILGIDEVGRGCLAGPVTVAAVALPIGYRVRGLGFRVKLRDSKKLSAKQREERSDYIRMNPKIFYAITNVYPKTIDRINISQAANLAATRALRKLYSMIGDRNARNARVFLDGGLYVNNPTSIIDRLEPRTIIKGDEKFNAIKLASIVAKVHRDRIMKRNHKKYPLYGFDQHVGYGTRIHIQAIKKHGFCELHRRSFLGNFVA